MNVTHLWQCTWDSISYTHLWAFFKVIGQTKTMTLRTCGLFYYKRTYGLCNFLGPTNDYGKIFWCIYDPIQNDIPKFMWNRTFNPSANFNCLWFLCDDLVSIWVHILFLLSPVRTWWRIRPLWIWFWHLRQRNSYPNRSFPCL